MTNEEVLQIIEQAAKDKTIDLDLGGYDLTEIPAEIGNLTNLIQLNLRENKLKTLPPEIGNLTKLKKLYLSDNKLTELPPEIGNLTELERIYLSKNKLTNLPPEIGNLKNLTYIYLRDNDLTSLPVEIAELPKLVFLDVRKTQLPVADEILENTHKPALIIESFFNAGKEETSTITTLNRARIIVVGAPTSGKTSVLELLKQNNTKSHVKPTPGLNIQKISINIEEEEVELNCWEFGHDELLFPLHKLLFTDKTIYLLVYDATNNEQENYLNYWLNCINSLSKKSSIILIANKIDKNFLTLDRSRLIKNYPNIKAILEISCLKKEGIESLLSFLLKEIQGLSIIKAQLTKAQQEIKKELEQNSKKYLTQAEYAQLCEAKEILKVPEQEKLLNLFQQIGLVVNLNEYIVEGQWLGEQFNQILSDGITNSTFETNSFLETIIDKSQLGFKSPYEDKFIFPHLGTDSAITWEDWEPLLKYRYKYNIPATSIIVLITTRLNAYIYEQSYSRNSVILTTDGSQALIKASDQELLIALKGEEEINKTFLNYICSEIENINSTYPGIEAVESIAIAQEQVGLEVESKTSIPPIAIVMSDPFIEISNDSSSNPTQPPSEEIPLANPTPKKKELFKMQEITPTPLEERQPPTVKKFSPPKPLYFVGLAILMAGVTIISYTLSLGLIPIIITGVFIVVIIFWMLQNN